MLRRDPTKYIERAEAAMKNADWQSAVLQWLTIKRKFKKRTPPRVYEKLAYSYRHQGKYGEAQTIIAEGIESYADCTPLYIERAEIAMSQSDWVTAVRLWEDIYKNTTSDIPEKVYVKLIRAYRQTKKLKQAERIAKRGVIAYPQSITLKKERAKLAYINGEWPLAARLWRTVIDEQTSPEPLQSYVQLSQSLRRTNDSDLAEKYAKSGQKVYPKSWEMNLELAEVITAKKDWPSALQKWQQFLHTHREEVSISPLIIQHARFNESIIKRIIDIDAYRQTIKNFQKREKKKSGRIAVYTSVSKGYESLKPHEVINERFDYFAFTDGDVDDMGIYEVRPIPVEGYDDGRAIRYAKTHPHVLFSSYDVAIWLDTSLMIVGDIFPIIEDFIKSGKAIGSSPHSQRQSVYEEFETCIKLQKDDVKIMQRQRDFYKSIKFDTNELTENGFLAFNMKHPKLAPALETWWEQICQFSKRDQLSFNYSLVKNDVEWHRLMKPPQNIRNHPDLVIAPHHDSTKVLDELVGKLK